MSATATANSQWLVSERFDAVFVLGILFLGVGSVLAVGSGLSFGWVLCVFCSRV